MTSASDRKTKVPLSNKKSKKKVKGTILDHLQHETAILHITHSKWNLFAWLLKPLRYVLTLYEAVMCNKATYLHYKQLVHGDNFVCAGGLWMCKFDDIKRNLIEPQARAFKLAPSPLDKQHLPRSSLPHKRLLFLLSLSQEGAGGDGDWEAYRGAVNDYITNPKTVIPRMKDPVVQKLKDQLVADYKKSADSEDGASKEAGTDFFTDVDSGLLDFLLKYLHFVLFGLDPFDKEIVEPMKALHYGESSAAFYLQNIGNLKFRWKLPKNLQKVADIYEKSPAISAMVEGQAKYKDMKRIDLAMLMVSIMSLAGMVGPKTLAYNILGHVGLPEYEGETTSEINVRDIWDDINLKDRNDVKNYIHECGRLRHAVSNSHKVAQEDFTVRVGRKDRKFKKGTIIYIPMQLAGLNKGVYGKDTFEFNHKRKNLCPYSTLFHSFGDQTNGRICPGREVAENMLTDVLIELGNVRRSIDIKEYGSC